jgi:hypothetical protein
MRSAKITVDCGGAREPSADTIDQIARLKLAARRLHCELELKNANPFLVELIGLAGLSEVLCLESRWEPEQRKQSGGVQEEGELRDPAF